jgi:hypothetical protein
MNSIARSTPQSTLSPTAVYICAAGHSGSTLLDLLIGSHTSAMSLGEITQMPKSLALNTACTCGQPVQACAVWSPIIERLSVLPRFSGLNRNPYALYLGLFEAGTVVDRRHQTALRTLWRRAAYAASFACWRWRLRPLGVFTGPLLQGARNKLCLFDVVAETESLSVVVDSSKHYLEAVSLHKASPARTKIVLLIRDGRAVFYSGLKRGHGRRHSLNAWLRTYRRALPLLRTQVPSTDRLDVRYEDLASNPARVLHRICEFIGIGFEREMLAFRAHRHHLMNGNDMRLSGSEAIRADESWKEGLSASDLDYFESRAGSLNRELGYQ